MPLNTPPTTICNVFTKLSVPNGGCPSAFQLLMTPPRSLELCQRKIGRHLGVSSIFSRSPINTTTTMSGPLTIDAILQGMADAIPTHPKGDQGSDLSSSYEVLALLIHAYMTALKFRLLGFDEDKRIGTCPYA